MSNPKAKQLAELETLIQINQVDFYALGEALQEIKDERLYLEEHFDSFECYL